MEKLFVYFKADDQQLVCCNPFRVSSKKVAYVEAHFDLGENWTGYDSVRAIWRNTQNFAIIGTVLDSQGICKVPTEVLTSIGQVDVNLVGSISENDVLTDRLTTYPVEAGQVDANALVDGSETAEITPSQFEQFAEAVRNDAERARTGAEAAESYADAAAGSADDAAGSAQSAADDAARIAQMIQDVIDQIEDFYGVTVSVQTLPAGSQATARYEEGHLYLGIPKGDKGDTGNGISSITKTGTSGLVDTYTITFTSGQTTTFAVTNGEKGDTGNGIASITKTGTSGLIDTYTITYTDGQTETFTVTNGEKGDTGNGIDRIELTSTSGYVKTYTIYFTDGSTTTFEVTDGEVSFEDLLDYTIIQNKNESVPYKFRQSGGGIGVGDIEYDKIVGGTITWNQQCITGLTRTEYGVTASISSDGRLTISGTPTSSNAEYRLFSGGLTIPQGHRVLFSGATEHFKIRLQGNYTYATNSRKSRIITAGSSLLAELVINLADAEIGTTYNEFCYPQIFDLTQMFGSTIADYIYSLEQANAGAGVAWFRNIFPNEYYEYDSGSLKSVEGLQSHDTTGFNQWDEEWEVGEINSTTGENASATKRIRTKNYIPVLPSATYYIATANLQWVCLYDANENYLGTATVTVSGSGGLIQTTDKTAYMRVSFNNAYGNTYNHDICINISDTSKNGQYEPYIKHSYPLDNSLTLRGIPKLADGKLYYDGDTYEADGTVTRKYSIVDLGTIDWVYYTAEGKAHRFMGSIPNGVKSVSYNLVCSKPYIINNNPVTSFVTDKCIILYNGAVWVTDNDYSDALSFKAAMSGVMLVYELDTPTVEEAQPYINPQLVNTQGTEEYVTDSIDPVGHDTRYPMTLDDTVPLTNGTYEMRVTVSNGEKSINWIPV